MISMTPSPIFVSVTTYVDALYKTRLRRNRWNLVALRVRREKDYKEHWPWELKDIEVGHSCASLRHL